MRIIYTFGILCYAMGVRIASLTNTKAKQLVNGWKQTFGKLLMAPVGNDKTAWFHVSSLGEFEQGRPVITAFRERHPEYKICLTFFSPSGYEVRKNYPEADFVCYLPPDTCDNARNFINLLQPSVVFFVKYDYWFNYLEQLRLRGIPTYIFSAIFEPKQYFFQWYGKWFLKHLQRCFTHLFVQNETSVELLLSHGVSQCSIAGDTRFDRVAAIAREAKKNAVVEYFLAQHAGEKIILAGSSWEPDEANLKLYKDKSEKPVALILAPHMIDEGHLERIESLFGKKECVRYSLLEKQCGKGNGTGVASVLIIDNIGMLSSLYQYSDIAYIGGGFGKGIHNTLEAITFGKPVVFGPNYRKFKEARDIIDRGGGFSYSRHNDLKKVLDNLLYDEANYQKATSVCREYMEENLGATTRIMEVVEKRTQDW